MGAPSLIRMETPKIDFLATGQAPGLPPEGRRPPVNGFSVVALFVATFIVSFAFGRLTLSQTAPFDFSAIEKIPIFGAVSHLIGSPDRQLDGEKNDRINILLLGMGGEEHEGPYLTDTIIVASIRPSDHSVAMLSVPRDLLVPLPKHGWRKVNAANAFGELKNPGHGADETREVLQGIFGIDIPYYVRVDFAGFRKLIDDVGGVDIHVDRAFTDTTFPTNDYKVQVISFKEGWEHMDGQRALQYARSRHGNDGEGSDFARAKRQQQVISALKDKLLADRTYRNPATIANLLATLRANVATNLQIGELLRLVRFAQGDEPLHILRKVIDNGTDSPLTDTYVEGAYVLVPKGDDWSGMRAVARDVFALATEDATAATPPPSAPVTRPTVDIRNGTDRNGLAKTVAGALTDGGFQVVRIANAASVNHARTLLYDLSGGKRNDILDKLRARLTDPLVIRGAPKGEDGGTSAEFVVILGRNEP
jgi:LCP family protein required for cell wall assembly